MKKIFLAGVLFAFNISYADNVVIDVVDFEKRLSKLVEMHAKECSPVELAYAEVYLESLKGGKLSEKSTEDYIVESKFKECGPLEIGYVKTCLDSYKVTKKGEKKDIVIRKNSVESVSYPVRISYYLSLIEKNIYSDKDGDGIPCYKEIELGLNPNVYDKIQHQQDKKEEIIIAQEQVKMDEPVLPAKEETVNPLNQPVRIHFHFNRADIKKEYLPYLNVVAKFLKMHKNINVKIVGYTDDVGSKVYNDKLALKRAQTVKNYLVKNGIEPSRIIIEGIGKDRYLVSNNDSIDRFTNRRAEFYVIKLAE